MMKKLLILCFVFSLLRAAAQPQPIPVGTTFTVNKTPVHDPVMIKEKGTYYIFCTGFGISVFSSNDLMTWKKEAPVFNKPPQWAVDTIPAFKGHIWAPDISFHNGQYYLYYSVSAFGKNTSAIGVATNKTLDASSPDFAWTDKGRVLQSYPGKTDWNAIDPNLALDAKGNPYLVFGSFWDGLKLIKLTNDLLHTAEATQRIPTIASRKKSLSDENPPAVDDNPKDAGGNAIEAPFIFEKGGYYYLFASIDYCCKGVNSTYKMIVGRAKKLEGPYTDKQGLEMRTGGGTVLLQGDKDWYGVGHNAVYADGNQDYLIFHGYDASDNGRSKLRIEKLAWIDGWPAVKAAMN